MIKLRLSTRTVEFLSSTVKMRKMFLFFGSVVSTVSYVFSMGASCIQPPSDSKGLVKTIRSEMEVILQRLTVLEKALSKLEYGLTVSDCALSSHTYTGKQNCTVSGRTCMEWSKKDPHVHYYRDNNFADGSMEKAGNYCRDPSNHGVPWCHTTDPNVVTENCNVPTCNAFL